MTARTQRVALVIAHQGFREEELDAPRAALAAAGVQVVVACSSLAPAQGLQGGTAYPDTLYSALRIGELDGLVFVGGYGAAEYFPDRTAHLLVQEAVRAGKVVGAICYGTSVLAEAGALEGRRATGYPAREAHLRARGALLTGDAVTVTGTIVTARGPEDADAFAQALVEALALTRA